jgi:hypothetical protein
MVNKHVYVDGTVQLTSLNQRKMLTYTCHYRSSSRAHIAWSCLVLTWWCGLLAWKLARRNVWPALAPVWLRRKHGYTCKRNLGVKMANLTWWYVIYWLLLHIIHMLCVELSATAIFCYGYDCLSGLLAWVFWFLPGVHGLGPDWAAARWGSGQLASSGGTPWRSVQAGHRCSSHFLGHGGWCWQGCGYHLSSSRLQYGCYWTDGWDYLVWGLETQTSEGVAQAWMGASCGTFDCLVLLGSSSSSCDSRGQPCACLKLLEIVVLTEFLFRFHHIT